MYGIAQWEKIVERARSRETARVHLPQTDDAINDQAPTRRAGAAAERHGPINDAHGQYNERGPSRQERWEEEEAGCVRFPKEKMARLL